MNISAAQLSRIFYPCPIATTSKYIDHINKAMAEGEINTYSRVTMFLAQIGHESGRLRYVREIWNPEQCPWQAGYEGRKDLGNTVPGDGSKFRGRGLMEITGRYNYTRCGEALGLSLTEHPELLEIPEYAVSSAVWFWNDHNLSPLADAGKFERITRIINGGLNGYDDRKLIWKTAERILEEV